MALRPLENPPARTKAGRFGAPCVSGVWRRAPLTQGARNGEVSASRAARTAFGISLYASLLFCSALGATDLERLAGAHSVAGAENWGYLLERLGPGATRTADSVSVSFGSGGPHTLIVAGVDGPGFAVSGFTDEGHLRLQRLAEPPPQYQFDSFWVGRRVSVVGAGRGAVAGVVAAPSVHFASDRGYGSRVTGVDRLFVDIGAASPEQARAAVSVLDRVSFDAELIRLGDDRLAGPWLSSYSGAAVLLALADHLRGSAPKGSVSLRFVGSQHFYNTGFRGAFALGADRTIILRSGGESSPRISAMGSSEKLVDELLESAGDDEFRRGARERFRFGPFEADPNPAGEAAILTLGVENAGTPVEVVRFTALAKAAALLARATGASADQDWRRRLTRERPAAGPTRSSADGLEQLIRELAAIEGVTGDESAVREAIRSRLPEWAGELSEVDEAGNLIVKLGPNPKAVFIAHMDEIGFEVTRIERDGRLAVSALGGGSEELFSWHPLIFYGSQGRVAGFMERFGSVNVGADDPEGVRKLGVDIGTTGSVPKRIQRLLGSRISGRSLDDRAGCAVLLSVLSRSSRREAPVWIVFSVREETGLVGAGAIAERTSVKRVYAIDSFVTSDSPLEQRRFADTPLEEGAVLRGADNSSLTPLTEVRRVLNLAEREGIALRPGVTAGGNDGSRFIPDGAANIPLSFPLRYSHTGVETADLTDIENLERLVAALFEAERL